MILNKKHETTRQLRVIYTDGERMELGKQLAGVHQALGQTEKDFDMVKADFKARITGHEAKIEDLSNKVASGYSVKEVKCRWYMDRPVKGVKQLIREDAFEVVETLDMTEADKQGELALEAEQLGSPTGVANSGVVQVQADKEKEDDQ